MTAFAIASIGLVGLPPINGFVSKWYLVLATIEAQQYVFLAILLISSLLNAAYFFPIIYQAFFQSSKAYKSYQEASYWMLFPLCLTALISLSLGIFPDAWLSLHQLALDAASNLGVRP